MVSVAVDVVVDYVSYIYSWFSRFFLRYSSFLKTLEFQIKLISIMWSPDQTGNINMTWWMGLDLDMMTLDWNWWLLIEWIDPMLHHISAFTFILMWYVGLLLLGSRLGTTTNGSLNSTVKIPCMGIVYKCFSFLYSSVLILGEVISVVVRSGYSQN